MPICCIDRLAHTFLADVSSDPRPSENLTMAVLPILRDASAYSFFFDFDGTLTEIAETPGAVVVEERARKALETLLEKASGAVAIVTGREIDSIDRFLAPLKLPVAGVHGYERRNGGKQTVSATAADESAARAVEKVLTSFVSHNPGLLLERKRGAIALHYRLRPELEAFCLSLVEDLAGRFQDVVLTRGKMVVEMRLHMATKGTAINDFLQEKPFKGRIPFFAGDDVTDEDAFAAVNALDGITVKVGPGETAARDRAGSVDEFLTWLLATAQCSKELG
jgi:trehalose 6-phosphate phosphatase